MDQPVLFHLNIQKGGEGVRMFGITSRSLVLRDFPKDQVISGEWGEARNEIRIPLGIGGWLALCGLCFW